MSDAWMQTASGKPFDLLEPRVEDVSRDDVIHHLARLARFSGATRARKPYMVLQYCYLVMTILESWGAPPVIVREGGWHECDEPYTGDLTRPLQLAIKEAHIERINKILSFVQASTENDLIRGMLEDLAQRDPMTEIRHRVGRVARLAFSLPPHESALVKRADNVALAIERRDLMATCSREWSLAEFAPPGITVGIVLEPEGCERLFREKMDAIEEGIRNTP